MDEHVTRWTGAYLDGELGRERLEQVEAHLVVCPACRQELETARQLSALLRSAPLPEGLPSAGDFAASLAPRLPARRPVLPPEAPRWTAPGLFWWLIPLVILAGWLSTQLVFLAQEWGWLISPLGLANTVIAWLSPDLFGSLWIDLAAASARQALGGSLPDWLLAFAADWGSTLIWTGLNALAAVLFLSWLAGLAARRAHLAWQFEQSI